MNSKKNFWITISLMNLCILALLGVTLRSKILFPLQGIEFTNILQAHSHFAFGGWVTMVLFSLLVYDILPPAMSSKKVYQMLLWCTWMTSAGMLISFVYQGYSLISNIFFIGFTINTFAFSYHFIRDLIISRVEPAIKVTLISGLIYLVLSSVGPFTLAYLMSTGSVNHLLYKDSTYTYLHMQYNGFFTLSVFALFINNFYRQFNLHQLKSARKFAGILSASIIPTLFISYLWHFTSTGFMILALVGCVFIILTIVYLFSYLLAVKSILEKVPRFTRNIGFLSIIAFVLKSILQTGTIIPSLGKLVFGDRAIIIGFLHLVLLGFISLYVFAHLLYSEILSLDVKVTRISIVTFIVGIIITELILMIQGFGNLLMLSNGIYTWLLWFASIWLFAGALMIFIARLRQRQITKMEE